jgi:iron complex transport system substrate-binding protein
MNRLSISLGFFIITLLALAACTPKMTDDLGNEVALASPAQRIISLSPPITEMLFAIGAEYQVIARDTFSDSPPEVSRLPDIGGSFGEYDLEAILSLQPDLVVAGEINTPEQVASLKDLGLTVYYLGNPPDIAGTFDAMRTLAVLSGHKAEAEKVIAGLQNRANAVTEKLEGITDRPSVYYELDASDPAKPFTPGAGTFYTELIAMAGGRSVTADLPSQWAQISLEQLLVEDPDLILLGDAMWGVTPESVAARPGWDALSAVKSGHVLPFDDNLIVRFGPRQVDGLEALAALFHPGLFE